jgi:hypothetical protein
VAEARSLARKLVEFADTDMLHRRAPLRYRCEMGLGGSFVAIKTDSPLMEEALAGLAGCIGAIAQDDHAEWEISVEARDLAAHFADEVQAETFETGCFGPSRSVRMSTGSWFAHTPPSMSGVGFVMVNGNGCRRTLQLVAYLKMVLRFLAESPTTADDAMECEVSA